MTSQCSHIHHRFMVDEFPVNSNTGATNLYRHIFQTVTVAYKMILLCNDNTYDTRVTAPAWGFDVSLCRIAFECAHPVASVIWYFVPVVEWPPSQIIIQYIWRGLLRYFDICYRWWNNWTTSHSTTTTTTTTTTAAPWLGDYLTDLLHMLN